ncbi:MAG: alpha/beta hydrolase [archaeon]|nr:alpha/beta hydrolase [archaeon]
MRNKIILLLILLILFLAGCAKTNIQKETPAVIDETQSSITEESSMEKVDFKTDDEFRIAGNLWRGNKEAVLLLHQLNMNKDSYNSFAQKLNKAGFTVLAIDSRGHGESMEQNGLKRNWNDFSEQDFKAMVFDAKAAKEFLQREGFVLTSVVGASVGANTALIFSALEPSIKKAVLLSPGLDYKGIQTEDVAKVARTKILIVASEEDAYSFGSSRALNRLLMNSEIKELNNAGHGTNMFIGTRLEFDVVKWLSG